MDSDTTLQSTLEDYQEKFCNKKCLLELNYKKMNDVIVVFSETDLHHLLGLHYVLPKNIYANKSIEMIKKKELLISDLSEHQDFFKMFSRFKNYNFIEKVFYGKEINICVVDKDIPPNRMKLKLVIYETTGRTAIVLGLRKINDSYKLVTLHESDSRKYNKARRTTIKNIKWLD